MKNILIIILFSFTINANDQIPAPPQKNPILLENGMIHTISNGVIKGSILLDKGKIIESVTIYLHQIMLKSLI